MYGTAPQVVTLARKCKAEAIWKPFTTTLDLCGFDVMNLWNTILYFLHVVAVVFWIGGIAYIVTVLMPAVPNIALRDRTAFMPVILRRFLVVVWTAIAILLLTGLHRVFFVWDITRSGFFATPIGHTLAIKLVLVAVLIGIALLVTLRTVPRAISHVLTHEGADPDEYKCMQCKEIVGGMRRQLQAALAVGLVIIYAGVELRGA